MRGNDAVFGSATGRAPATNVDIARCCDIEGGTINTGLTSGNDFHYGLLTPYQGVQRLFFGLPVSEELAGRIGDLRRPHAGVRWTRDRNLHITVEFLGNGRPEQVAALTAEMESVRPSRVLLEITELTCYPDRRRCRVLALEMNPDEEFRSLYSWVRQASGRAGFDLKKERLSPHVTIARVKNADAGWLANYLAELAPLVASFPPYEGDRLNLYESVLHRTGAEYAVVDSTQLR